MFPDLTLRADPDRLADRFRTAQPFPHVVVDGLFEDERIQGVLEDFPLPGEIEWDQFDSPTEKKLGYSYRSRLRERVELFLFQMSSAPVLEFLERLTGIAGLMPDPYFGGAGPHRIERGGFLEIHADFNVHPILNLDRRLNVLVYLNRNWQDDYGGHLELWERDASRCAERILPLFNRTVVFATTDDSYHGHPIPLTCPEGESRKSVSFYYYTAGRPEDERSAPHDTIFRSS